ncbi:MAG: hypothetical protein ABSA52_21710 [Candidatus Binatia bacterium]|jgi:hypothetical protein
MRVNKKQKPAGRFETSPERLACISDVIDAVLDAGGITAHDALNDEASLRALASNLQLPYLAVQISRLGTGGLSETDVDEYNTWRAALDKGGVR